MLRLAARVVLVDDDDRILLIGTRIPDVDLVVWLCPGGGLEPGETARVAAARELREELGLALPPEALEGPVWTRAHSFTFEGRRYDQRETYFVARLPRDAAITAFPEDTHEARYLVGMRWLGLADLEAWSEATVPRRLAALLPPILAGERPDPPIETGV